MDRDVWDGADQRRGDFTGRTQALVNGSSIDITPGSSFKEVVLQLSKDAGFGKFRVLLNGSEIKPSMAPEQISEGDKIEVRPYDVAGF
jgi:hypothetical protein